MEKEISLDWLIENYLPDYDERITIYLGQCFQNGDEIECVEDLFLYFNIEHFSEALTCYRESILKNSEKEIYKVTDSYGYMNQFEKNSSEERNHLFFLLKKANEAMRSAYNVLNGINFMTPKGTPNRVETALDRSLKHSMHDIEQVLDKK
jgi:hypothetical protein